MVGSLELGDLTIDSSWTPVPTFTSLFGSISKQSVSFST